jgi:hypothetical protein
VTAKINKDFGDPFLISGVPFTMPTGGQLTKELFAHLETFMVGRKSPNTEKYAKVILHYLIRPDIYAIRGGPGGVWEEKWILIRKMREDLVVQKRAGRPNKKIVENDNLIPHGDSFKRVLDRLIDVNILEKSEDGLFCRINMFSLTTTDTKDKENEVLWGQIYRNKEWQELLGKQIFIYVHWLWELFGPEYVDKEFKRRYEETFEPFPIKLKSPELYKK